MSLRLRLIVVFFLLSVVPLAAVTFYTYLSNAEAMREAAGREAQLLAGELTERMRVVTEELSQQFERLMELPESPASVSATLAPAAAADESVSEVASEVVMSEVEQVAEQLGEVAMLLNNIDVRGFGRRGGRGGRGGGRGTPPGATPDGANGPEGSPRGGAPEDGQPPGAPPLAVDVQGAGADDDAGVGPPDAPSLTGGRDGRGGATGRRQLPADEGQPRGRSGGPRSQEDVAPADPGRIQIDLGPIRREIVRELFPERERFDQLSPAERERVLAIVNERMLGIQQGIRIVQEAAAEQAAEARAQADETVAEQPPAAPTPPTPPPAPTPTEPAVSASTEPMRRMTELSGGRIDVRVEQGGEVVGQVNAELNMPNLLAAVFTATARERGEVPFAIDQEGRLYAPSPDDRAQIEALDAASADSTVVPSLMRPDAPPGTTVVGNWVIVTRADPTGSGLIFGIARPLGDALDDLRRSSARNAGLGLAFIGLALIGIVPISTRLTRNLSRLSEGVHRIAQGDYRARVPVRSSDEVGTLAKAFNQMAEDVEQHQRSAVRQERLRRELELGRQIQHDMLPQAPLRLGLTEIRGVSVPALEVGGDFFNYFQTSAGKVALLVGDVSGKGVGAALLMANIQASLRTRLALGQDLASIAAELDTDIEASTPGPVYATLFIGLLDPAARELRYVNAGHNPQYVLRRGGGLERMESTGLPVGLLAGRGYLERTVQLEAGDVLFFYTDGCVEAEDEQGEMLGADRLEALLLSRPSGERDDVLARVEREVRTFRAGREAFDDATMMVVDVG